MAGSKAGLLYVSLGEGRGIFPTTPFGKPKRLKLRVCTSVKHCAGLAERCGGWMVRRRRVCGRGMKHEGLLLSLDLSMGYESPLIRVG